MKNLPNSSIRTLLSVVLLFVTLNAFAQKHNNDSVVSAYHKYRSDFIDNKTQLLGLSVFTRNRDNQMAIAGTQRLTYYPNDVTAIGVRIQHKWLGLAITYSPQFLQPEEKGKTKEIDLHVYVYGRKHNVDAYYMSYKGFYIDNYRKNATLRNAYQQYPLLPDMTLEGAGINYFYVFNHKRYSLRSTYLHNEVQKKVQALSCWAPRLITSTSQTPRQFFLMNLTAFLTTTKNSLTEHFT